MSSEILYLLDSAQGVCMLEGNISRRDMASCERSPGVARPLALYIMSSKQPVIPFGKRPKKLPAVLSAAEVNRLLSCVKCQRHRMFLQPGPNRLHAG